jgi:nitrate reductase assembly molybdenum cofactor insertion protein NarJ
VTRSAACPDRPLIHLRCERRANAIAKRWIGTVRRELPDRILILNRRHLEHVLAEYTTHFNQRRSTAPCGTQHHLGQSHRPRPNPTFASDVTTGAVD